MRTRLDYGKRGWQNQECRKGGCCQSADNGPAQRSDLLPSFSKAERHRDHTGNHREARHENWPQPAAGAFDRSF